MFGAYSRAVDHKTFTRLNQWLSSKDYHTNAKELEKFISLCKNTSPVRFFSPSTYPDVQIRRQTWGDVRHITYESTCSSGYRENDTVQGEIYLRYPVSAPAAVFINGWLMNDIDLTRLAEWVARTGRNLWTIDIPYHSRRTPEGFRGGELFITGDILRTLEGVRQLTADIMVLVKAIRELGTRDIAVFGFSLGAWALAILAGLEPAITRVILACPVVRPDKLLEQSPYFSFIRKGLDGVSPSFLYVSLAQLYLPGFLSPGIDPSRIHVIGAHEDILASPSVVSELANNWNCNSQIFPGGHVTVNFLPRYWRRILTLLNVN